MSGKALTRLRPKVLILAAAVAFPAILFYTVLFRQALNIPLFDDYDALLDFLNQMTELRTGPAKASYFLVAQHNEYKLFFERGLAWLELIFSGHIDLRFLCALGNGFVLLLGILLWKMFLPNHKNLAFRLAFFVPISWLLFQLQYIGTLNWAMGSLQNFPVLFFSLGAIYLLVRETRWGFCAALVFLVLAIASSGNGLLLVPIGILILVANHTYVRVMSWLAVSAGCIGAYAYHYNTMSSQSPVHDSIFAALMGLRLLFVIAFIGNAAAFPINQHFLGVGAILCPFLGVVLCIFFFYLVRRGYSQRNPLVSYCVLFLLLTAVGVAGLRSDLGLMQSLSSRYGIYSALFLIFAWVAIVEEFLQYKSAPLRRNGALLSAIAVSVLFCLGMDVGGWHYSIDRNRKLVRGMAVYEHPISPDSIAGPILPMPHQPARSDAVDLQSRATLTKSIALGIYRPPAF